MGKVEHFPGAKNSINLNKKKIEMEESIKFFVKNLKMVCGLIQRIFHGLASFCQFV